MNELERLIAMKHWAGTEAEATDVSTPAFKAGLRAVEHVADCRFLACFFGPPGTGKSLTALTACARLKVRPFYVPIARTGSGKDVEFQILTRVDPARADYRLTRHVMRQYIVEELARAKSLLVLDEFDVMESAGADVLRFMIEQKMAGYIVVGSKADQVLHRYPALRSRCARWISFTPMSSETLVTSLGAYHPVFAQTVPAVLHRVDREWANGVFREWAKILEAALRLPESERKSGLSYDAVKKCFLLIGKPGREAA